MRRFSVLAMLCIAGCQVASRDATEFEFLGEVEALIDARDRCGLYSLVTGRPGALAGRDALAVEFREFVERSRTACRFGALPSADGGSAAFPDTQLVAEARRQRADERDVQGRFDALLAPVGSTGGALDGRERSSETRPPAPETRSGTEDADNRPSHADRGDRQRPSTGRGADSGADKPRREKDRGERPSRDRDRRDDPGRPDDRGNREGKGRGPDKRE